MLTISMFFGSRRRLLFIPLFFMWLKLIGLRSSSLMILVHTLPSVSMCFAVTHHPVARSLAIF